MVASTTSTGPSESSASSISDRKRLANQRNAQKSTGPRTPEGKERSSRNATTHGFFAHDVLVIGEDSAEFKEYRISLLRRLDPRDELEMQYAEQVIGAGWKLKRLRAAECSSYERQIRKGLEAARAAIRMQHGLDQVIEPGPEDAARLLGSDLRQPKPGFVRFQSYEVRLQNMMNKALAQLRALQKEPQRGILSSYTGDVIDKENGKVRDFENEATVPIPSTSDDAESACDKRSFDPPVHPMPRPRDEPGARPRGPVEVRPPGS